MTATPVRRKGEPLAAFRRRVVADFRRETMRELVAAGGVRVHDDGQLAADEIDEDERHDRLRTELATLPPARLPGEPLDVWLDRQERRLAIRVELGEL